MNAGLGLGIKILTRDTEGSIRIRQSNAQGLHNADECFRIDSRTKVLMDQFQMDWSVVTVAIIQRVATLSIFALAHMLRTWPIWLKEEGRIMQRANFTENTN